MGAAILEFAGYAGDTAIYNLTRINELIIMIYTRHPHASEHGPGCGTVGPLLGRLSERASEARRGVGWPKAESDGKTGYGTLMSS